MAVRYCEHFALHVLSRLRMQEPRVPIACPDAFPVRSEQRSDSVVWSADGEFKSVFHVRDWALILTGAQMEKHDNHCRQNQ